MHSKTLFYKFFASSIVSGSFFEYVSGQSSTISDPKMAVPAKRNAGSEL